MRARASSILAGFQYGASSAACRRGILRDGEIVRAQRGAAERIVAFRHLWVPRRKATEQFHDVGRRSLAADHGQQREKPRGGTDVDGVEQVAEMPFRLVEPVHLECDSPAYRRACSLVGFNSQPALRGEGRLAELEAVERDARRLLGDRFIVRLLGGLAI